MKKILIILILFLLFSKNLFSYSRIVSLNPSITQILFAIGVGDKVVGVTYHDTLPFEATKKRIVGGFFSPSIERIKQLNPDIIFCSSFHKKIINYFNHKCKVIVLEAHNIKDIYKNILFLGSLFEKKREAEKIVEKNKEEIELIRKKLQFIPYNKRRKVVRIMGPGFVPGKDSFQIDVIKKAGGIPFVPDKKGNIYKISLKQWQDFNPDIIYICGNDKNFLKNFFNKKGWRDVNAVKKHKIFTFPCVLTCRPSIYTGYFIQWLSASIYGDYFFKDKNIFIKKKILKRESLKNNFEFIKNIELVTGIINDFHHKTLLIEFKNNMRILSTLDGFRKVKYVGNHYLVPPRWSEGHKNFKLFKKEVANSLGLTIKNSSLLYTGANMDNLAYNYKKFKDMKIEVFATAGVRSNAMRAGYDKGIFINHGTINIIVLTNLNLTERAMARSLITVTEAKTEAMQELDIRSSYSPILNQATGTGTDNIIIVSGNCRRKDIAGGHSKFAEIVAKLVKKSVKEAILKQNRIVSNRNIFQRLEERNIRLFSLAKIAAKYNAKTVKENLSGIENILLNKKYANNLKLCLSAADDFRYQLIDDFSFITNLFPWQIKRFKETELPFPVNRCVDAIISGVVIQVQGIKN